MPYAFNLFIIRLSHSTVLASFLRRFGWEMSESRQHPVVAPDAILEDDFNTGEEEGKLYSQKNAPKRALQSRAKIIHEAKLRHVSMQYSSCNAVTAIRFKRTIK